MTAALCTILLAAPSFTPHTAYRTPASPPRSPLPTAAIAFDAIQFSANPISLTIVAFTVAWSAAPIIGSTKLREASIIQDGPKFPTTKREAPRIRGARLSKEALAVTEGFQQSYSAKELELLWAALLRCYGSESLALAAVRDNPQMLNPSYSFCNTMLDSAQALRSIMSDAEALEVMKSNPAVLQCGPSLGLLGAGEIKSFAQARRFGNALVPAQARGAAVGAFVTTIAAVILLQASNDPQIQALLTVLRPALGGVLASSFLFSAYAAAKSS